MLAMGQLGNQIKSSDDICYITVADESDLESERLPPCDARSPQTINVRNATNTLDLGGLEALRLTQWVDVAQSPQLRILDFPQVERLGGLSVHDAEALSSILLSDISSPPPIMWDSGYSMGAIAIDITDAPSLVELDLQKATGLHVLSLRNVPSLLWENPNITSIVILESDACFYLPALEMSRDLHLTGSRVDNCFGMLSLTSVYNFTLTNVGPLEVTFGSKALTVRNTLILESTIVDPFTFDHNLDLSPITSVGSNAYITSNANMHIDISGLKSVKGNLSISDNRNCAFNFDHLEEVGNLVVMDNSDTPLPSFPSLARAKNIHLRGRINQSNIFPALIRVSGKVTIETWNDDFNCSKLVSQQRDDIIYDLSCNGTNNGIQANDPIEIPAPSSSSLGSDGLTQGAKVGIGIGVTVSALSAIVALVWLILRFKLQRAALSQQYSSYSYFPLSNAAIPVAAHDEHMATGLYISEAQGQEDAHKKSDEQAVEADGRVPISAQRWLEERGMMIRDKSENEYHEMPTLFLPPEL